MNRIFFLGMHPAINFSESQKKIKEIETVDTLDRFYFHAEGLDIRIASMADAVEKVIGAAHWA